MDVKPNLSVEKKPILNVEGAVQVAELTEAATIPISNPSIQQQQQQPTQTQITTAAAAAAASLTTTTTTAAATTTTPLLNTPTIASLLSGTSGVGGVPGTTAGVSSSSGTGQLTVDQVDIEILPVIYDIIRCVEKDPIDNTAKQRESQECNQKIIELQKRFDSARSQIKQLPGIDYNKEEQEEKLELLRNQLKLKQELIKKYKDVQF